MAEREFRALRQLTVSNTSATANLTPIELNIGAIAVINTTTIQLGTAFVVNTSVLAFGANVLLDTVKLSVGNSTANLIANSTIVKVANSTGTSNLTPTSLQIAANVLLDTVKLRIGNSTANSTANSIVFQVANSTGTANLKPTVLEIKNLTITGNISANGALGSGGQALLSNSTGGVYWGSPSGSVNGASIAALTEKTTLSDDDLFVIADSDDSNNAKKFRKSNLSSYMFKVLAADDTGQNVNTAQPWFPTAGAVALASGTTYRFRGFIHISRSAGTTSHTTSQLFGGTAVLESIRYKIHSSTGDTVANATENGSVHDAATAIVVKAASTSATEQITICVEGVVRVTTGGTFIPQFQYSAAPGGVPTIKKNSFFELIEIGTSAVVSAGTWS